MALTRVCAAALGAVLVACGGGQPPELQTSDEPTPLAILDGSAADLTGTWVQLVTTAAESSAPLVGTVTTENRRLFLVQLTHTGDEITGASTLCDMTVETSTAMATTVVPDAFVTAVGEHTWTATFTEGVFASGRTWRTLGLSGVSEDEPLPTTADDPLVFDGDDDGHPGVTIEVTGLAGGQMYFVQRGWRELESTLVSGSRIEGVVRWDDERVILDATSRSLRNARPAEPVDDPSSNRFVMIRVDDGTTCSDARRAPFGG